MIGLLTKFGNLTRAIPGKTVVNAPDRIMASDWVKRHSIEKR